MAETVSSETGQITVRFDPASRLLECRFEGRVGSAQLAEFAEAAIRESAGHTLRGVLFDARASTPAYSHGEMIDTLEQGLEAASPQRCAFLVSEMTEERQRQAVLLEAASVPFAVKVRAFTDEAEARSWAGGV
ncbi:MAG: hypothetical protein AAFX09_04530 [Pseudomonadota bacterium]